MRFDAPRAAMRAAWRLVMIAALLLSGAKAGSDVHVWGDAEYGGVLTAQMQAALNAAPGISHVASTDVAFMVRTTGGVFYVWGDAYMGGSLSAEMQTALNAVPGISHVASTDYAFMVRTTDGIFYVWGNADRGGSLTAEMQAALNAAPGISHVASTDRAFMVRTTDGVLYVWGNANGGGSLTAEMQAALNAAPGISHVASTERAFMVRTTDGVCHVWGNAEYGGSLTAQMQTALNAAPGISHVASTVSAFMVRTTDGIFYVWGNAGEGGSLTAEMQADLNAAPGISHVASTNSAFMVRTTDGVLYVWGNAYTGGSLTAEMQAALNAAPGISHVASTGLAFMVRTTDGVCYVWGDAEYGGSLTTQMQAALNAAPGISHVASTECAFMVRTTDGVCYVWGFAGYGGSLTTQMQAALNAAPGISHVASTDRAFMVAACPAGQYAFSVFDPASTMCYDELTCGPGFFSTSTTQTECAPCTAGKYSDVADDASDCIGCIAGKYIDVIGSDEASDCIDCLAGKYIDVAGSDEAADCIDCVAGKYIDVIGSDEASDCIGCIAGKYIDVIGSDEAADCIDCAAGKWTAEAGSIELTACRKLHSSNPAGILTSCSTDRCDPLVCSDGTTLVPDSTGYFFALEATTAQEACCLPACPQPDGRCACGLEESRTAGASEEPFAATTCDPCPPGQQAPGFDDACAVPPGGCEPGSFLRGVGAADCLSCPAPSRCLGSGGCGSDDATLEQLVACQCTEGSVGVACASCDIAADPKWYAFNGGCQRCPTDPGIAMILLSMIAIAAFMLALSHLTGVNPEHAQGATKMLGSIAAIAFGHLQMSVHIFTLPSIPWPAWLRRLMQLLRNIAFISFADFSQPECQADTADPQQLFLIKFFLKQGIFAVLFGVFFAMFLFGKLTGATRMEHHGINSMTALFSICFLLLVRSNSAIFDCSTQPDVPAQCSDAAYTTEAMCPCDATWQQATVGGVTLDEFPAMGCAGGIWQAVAIFSAVSLVLYVVVLPTFFLRKLSVAKADGTLVEPEVKAKFGWLFLRYKYHACTYFEFLAMARKATVVLLGMFVSSQGAVLALTAIVIGAALVLQIVLRPYSDHEVDHDDEDTHDRYAWTEPDKLDALGMACELLSLSCGLYFVGLDVDADKDGFVYLAVGLVALTAAALPIAVAAFYGWTSHKAQAEHIAARAQEMDEAEKGGKGGKKTTATTKSDKKKGQEVEFGNPLADSEEDEGGKKTETKKGKGKGK